MKLRQRQIRRYCRMRGKRVAKHQWVVGNRWYLIRDGDVYWAPVEVTNAE